VWKVSERLQPAQWYASLPSFLASASALITDGSGSVLAVKPNYRPWWNLPGGIMEAGEPPHVCCVREVAEELGLTIGLGRLLVIDWVPPTDVRKAWFGYVFDGGVLDDLSRVSLQDEELDAFAFIGQHLLRERLTENTADRVEAALTARASGGGVAYLHNGVIVEQVGSVAPSQA
jgi:8-oxo-dGTP diphosphatase